MSEEIENIKNALKSGRVHITIARKTFCDLVIRSGTKDEGAVRSAAALAKADDIPCVTVLASLVSEMIGGQADDSV